MKTKILLCTLCVGMLTFFNGCGKENNNSDISKPVTTTVSEDASSIVDIKQKVVDYIINGQGDKPEADKLKWNEAFLKRVDINKLSATYTSNGGNISDIKALAEYVTQNAPILPDWQQLFKKSVKDTYGMDIVKIEPLEGDLYEAYIKNEGSEVPYVVVSSRTGYYHG